MKPCPFCRKEGRKVKAITVKHLVVEELRSEITDEDYLLCMSETCDVVYYGSDSNVQIKKEQVKVPVWFKDDANPKYICYCSQITEEDIIDAVKNEGARTLKDIIKITGAMKNCNCEAKNPTGECCSPFILETIKNHVD